MSNDKSIFEPKEGFASEPPSRSPFAVDEPADSPFASTPDGKSPFAMDDDDSATRLSSGGSKPPEKPSNPFASDPGKSPFGYEPPVAGFGGSPFEGSPSPNAPKGSPFAVADAAAGEATKETSSGSPFGEEKPPGLPAAEVAADSSTTSETPSTPAAAAPAEVGESDSSSIRQLELRAIFGVARELSESEILERSRALPGIRHLARISNNDVGAIEGIKRILGNLDFGGGQVQLYCNNAPIVFIREGSVMLAVQNDGSFAPGVRETLMIVARELGRI